MKGMLTSMGGEVDSWVIFLRGAIKAAKDL